MARLINGEVQPSLPAALQPCRPDLSEDEPATVLARIAAGEGIHAVLADLGVGAGTFYGHLARFEEARSRYARARQLGLYARADRLEELQDEEPLLIDTQFGRRVDAGWVAWQKNRVDRQKWLLSRLAPAIYGKKIEQVDSTGHATLAALERGRARALRELGRPQS